VKVVSGRSRHLAPRCGRVDIHMTFFGTSARESPKDLQPLESRAQSQPMRTLCIRSQALGPSRAAARVPSPMVTNHAPEAGSR